VLCVVVMASSNERKDPVKIIKALCARVVSYNEETMQEIALALADDDNVRRVAEMIVKEKDLAKDEPLPGNKFIMRPSSLGGGRILRRTLSVCLSVCPSVPLSDVVFFI